MLPWNATVGAFAQPGQPWEEWSFEPYRSLTSSTSETNRYAEPAGSRRSPAHWQIDLNYTQSFRLRGRASFQVVADVFNLFDKQTGYIDRRTGADSPRHRDARRRISGLRKARA